jgi:hypothetical protein
MRKLKGTQKVTWEQLEKFNKHQIKALNEGFIPEELITDNDKEDEYYLNKIENKNKFHDLKLSPELQ